MGNKTALLIGATGLVGEQLLKELISSATYNKIVVLARRNLTISNAKLEVIITDFENIDGLKSKIKADDVYNAMGTTIATAGSKEAFKRVDLDIPLKVAELALWNGAKQFINVSSLSANADSPVFYSKTKAQLEEGVKSLKYEAVLTFRPSLLMGNRKEKRFGESIAQSIADKMPFIFSGPLKKYKGMPADLLAHVMVKLGSGTNKGFRIIDNEEIFEISGKKG